MTEKLDLSDPIAVLLAVAESLRQARIECAVYGGLALAVYGQPRETKDADLAIVGVEAQTGAAALQRAGLDTLVAFDRTPFGGLLVSRLTIVGEDPSGLNTADLVEPRSERFAVQALERAMEGTLRGVTVSVLTPEDFVLYKLLSTRERDLEDAVTVVRELAERIDLSYVRSEARTLATEIADHDISGHLDRLLDAVT